jgi:hypothetical protein
MERRHCGVRGHRWGRLFPGRGGGSGGHGRARSGVVCEEKWPGVRDDKRAPLIREREGKAGWAGLDRCLLGWSGSRVGPVAAFLFFCSGSFSFLFYDCFITLSFGNQVH